MSLDKLTWKCYICKKERPDDKISVLSYDLMGMTYGVHNLKYCNDNPDCLLKAQQKAETKKL